MGTKLRNAPLFYVIAQVQFNAILDLENYLPKIQAKMREANYPDYKSEIVQQFMMPMSVSETQMTLNRMSRHSFGDIEGKSIFLLDTNALTFHTTAYDTYETFEKDLRLGLDIINSQVGLSLVERIGIRYLDAVFPQNSSESICDYLVPEVRGLYDKIKCKVTHSYSETVGTTSAGQIISRVVVKDGPIGIPEGFNIHPGIDAKFTSWNGVHAIVDSDGFEIKREPFDIEVISTKLAALHDVIKDSFKAIVTEHAWKVWT